jgi:hypothetical protein
VDLINEQPSELGIPKMKKALTTIIMQTPDFSAANLKTLLEKRMMPPDTVTELSGHLSSAMKDLEPGADRQAWAPWLDIKAYQPPQTPDELAAEAGRMVDPDEEEEKMLRKAAFAQASKAAGEGASGEMGLSDFLNQ